MTPSVPASPRKQPVKGSASWTLIAPQISVLFVGYWSRRSPTASNFMETKLPLPLLLARIGGILCMLALAVLSWTPGPYMVRTGMLSGHEEHFLAYLLTALTISTAQGRTMPPAWTGLVLALYASMLELGQLYVAGRHPAVADLCASAFGALIGVAVALAFSRATTRVGQ